MNPQNKICQNCKKDFTIESEDFNFYEKIKVPAPTFCPECRFLRRFCWRNERTLYKRTCDLCKKSVISTYPVEAPFPVYCKECWYGDGWNATTFGQDLDLSRPFFEQYKELMKKVPRFALWQRNVINSEYSNMVGESRNVYLSASVVVGCENIFYSKNIDASYNLFDCYNVKTSEQCYENVEGTKNYNSQHLFLSRNCIDSYFLVDCANCSNCFMCSNLRNKEYHIRNIKYSREDYLKEMSKFDLLGSRAARETLLEEFRLLCSNAIYRFASIIQSYNSTGNNLLNAKNCRYCFDAYDGENFKYCYRAFTSKDCMDYDYGQTSELMYEYITGANHDYGVKFSYSALENVRDAEYTDCCMASSNLFGCIGVRDKKNVILNKVYPKEEFLKLREQIIKQMNDLPYVDGAGRVYRYGEFFPIDVSPYAYNETVAQEFMPITKEEAVVKGYRWKDLDSKNYDITLAPENIPDNIADVKETITSEVLGCKHKGACNHQCLVAFRITQGELQYYKKHNIPIPNKCSNCRYYERFTQVPLPKLYNGECVCENGEHTHGEGKCKNKFLTPYRPGTFPKVYCESCYNKEVY